MYRGTTVHRNKKTQLSLTNPRAMLLKSGSWDTQGHSLRIFRRVIHSHKVKLWGYQMVYISRSCFRSAIHNTGCDRRTGRQTRRCRKDRAMHGVARVKRCGTMTYKQSDCALTIALSPIKADCMRAKAVRISKTRPVPVLLSTTICFVWRIRW